VPLIRKNELLTRGFVHLRERHASKADAWATARAVFAAAAQEDPPLQVVGEFTLPPAGAVRRDFQTLHIDFGLPIDGREPVDVARFTALYIDPGHAPTTALTRIVPLRSLLGQRTWCSRETLSGRLRAYTRAGSVEGILARLVEAADGSSALPSTADPDFLCGMEFASLEEERAHFAKHALELDAVEHRVRLGPGELLLFDNLATAHGRAGSRRPEELHQLCVGHRALDVARQHALLSWVLEAFDGAHE
jgi:hypothetical protein